MFETLKRVRANDDDARAELRALLRDRLWTAEDLTLLAVRNAGDDGTRALLHGHLQDFTWNDAVPLQLQEYETVLPDDAGFHLTLRSAYFESAWAPAHLRALAESPVEGAARLLEDFERIAREAARLVEQVLGMRRLLDGNLHVLQTQALLRAELAGWTPAGSRVLEVGPQDGLLFNHLRRLGAEVYGVDLKPQLESPFILQGDFMTVELPGPFDMVVATAVFEEGSGWTLHVTDPEHGTRRLLRRLHALTRPGGLVVLENVGYGMLFTSEEARQEGFEVLPQRIPCAVARRGGRGCALRRR